MKKIFLGIILLTLTNTYSQSFINKEKGLNPYLWLGVWDKSNSEKTFKIDYLDYNEIPKYLNFRGTVVESLTWKDAVGENILIHSITGDYKWMKTKPTADKGGGNLDDKSEVFVYFFQKTKDDLEFKLKWRIYDFTECVDQAIYSGFIKIATTITDLDKDGVSEISVPYLLICRERRTPGKMKIIMYEGDKKYALRGNSAICDKGRPSKNQFNADKSLLNHKLFYDFLNSRWEEHKCEKLN